MKKIKTQLIALWTFISTYLYLITKPLAYRRYIKVYKALKKLEDTGIEPPFLKGKMMSYSEYRAVSTFPNYTYSETDSSVPLMNFYKGYKILAKYKYLNMNGTIPKELGIEIPVYKINHEIPLHTRDWHVSPLEKDFYDQVFKKNDIVQTWTDLASDITTRTPMMIDTELTEKIQTPTISKAY